MRAVDGARRTVGAMFLVIVLVIVVLLAGATGFVRLAGHDPDRWHVDPLAAPKPSSPNSYRVGPPSGSQGASVEPDTPARTYPVPTDELAAAFDAVATADERVVVVAGSASAGHVTYVQRSKAMAFPDYVSVRFLEADGGSTISVFSRARYGYRDFDVNRQRVERWLAAVGERVG